MKDTKVIHATLDALKDAKVIPATLAALRKMKDIDFSNNRMRPCFAIFNDDINNIHKIFNHCTARQQNKYLYESWCTKDWIKRVYLV